jgi:hypothetical protein
MTITIAPRDPRDPPVAHRYLTDVSACGAFLLYKDPLPLSGYLMRRLDIPAGATVTIAED